MIDSNCKFRHDGDEMPSVMAVVLNYNGFEDTVKCIHSLQNATYPNLSIVLVDNGSPDGSGERLEKEFPSLSLIRLKNNTGYAAGNNVGIRFAMEQRVDYILVINNDVIVEPTFLEPMISLAEKKPDIGIVTCKVFYQFAPKEIFSAAGQMNWWLCTGVNHGSYIKKYRKVDQQCYTDFACGVLMLIKKKLLETNGLFDEKYYMYFEDVEFSRRILHQYKIAYTPLGIVYHKSGGGKGWRSYTELYLYYHTRNRFWVFRNDHYLYRVYVLLFALVNVLLKSFTILSNILHDRKRMIRQLKSLWRGFRDGIFTSSF